MPRLLRPSLAVALCLLAAPAGGGEVHRAAPPDQAVSFSEYVPGASVLEGRIRAPCCWNQTLDIHGSEVSNALRREIRRRLTAGETVDAIQADLVKRYGERILATPPGSPMLLWSVVLGAGLLGAGAGLFGMLRRWRARSGGAPVGAEAARPRDELDARIDAELERLE